MAEFLIRYSDKTDPDPIIDALCEKRGDIIVVMPDGHAWGPGELEPNNPQRQFCVVKVPGLDHVQWGNLSDPYWQDTGQVNPAGEKIYKLLANRQFNIPKSLLPTDIKTALRDNGEMTIAKNKIANYLRDKGII